MDAKEFNKLSSREKWTIYKTVSGTWHCPRCKNKLNDGPIRCSPFSGASRHCSNCDELLTRRTGGGQNDPFCWILKDK